MKIELYNEKTGTGLLRHVMIRYAHSTNQVMVVFVTSKVQFPSRRNLVNALVEKISSNRDDRSKYQYAEHECRDPK